MMDAQNMDIQEILASFHMEDLIQNKIDTWEQMWKEYEGRGLFRLPLWEKNDYRLPHTEGFTPQILVYPPHQGAAVGAVLVCAGGAFLFKTMEEAKPTAEFFYDKGFQVALLDYNTNPANGMGGDPAVRNAAGEDGLRAIRMLRAHAEEWNIRPDKIAILGFSAGGDVSGYVGTHFEDGDPTSADPVERESSRPDAVIMVYASYTSHSTKTPGPGCFSFDSQRQQIGFMSTDLDLRRDCPPFFLTQSCSDDPRDAFYYGIALTNRGIPNEVHTFTRGSHGGGLYDGAYESTELQEHTRNWAPLAASWLRYEQKFLA